MDPFAAPYVIACDLDAAAGWADTARVAAPSGSWPDLAADELVDVLRAAAGLLATGTDRLTLMLAAQHLTAAVRLLELLDGQLQLEQVASTVALAESGLLAARGR